MYYVTIDSKISVEGTTIEQKRLTKSFTKNFFIYAFLFVWFVNLFIEKITLALEKGNATKWISVVIFGSIFFLYIGVLYDFLFRRYWKNKLFISNIREIRVAPSDEGLETDVVVTLKSNRYKLFKFRTLEKQYDSFIENVRSINPDIQLVTE